MQTAAAIILLGAIFSVLVIVVAVLFLRYRSQQMLHQERLAAMEKGTSVPLIPAAAPWSPRVYLLRGLMWTLSSVGLIVFLFGIAVSSRHPASGEVIMWRAKNLSNTAGITLDQARQIVEKDDANQEGRPPSSISLLGLIPFGVGLAYLVFYYTGDSRQKAGNGGGA